jgi:phosphatidylglycerol:prolipoprotein diacylglycerol transferase
MRPRIVDFLNRATGVEHFDWIVPDPTLVYPIALLVVAFVFARRCASTGTDRRLILALVAAGSIGAFVGAKLIYVLVHLRSYILLPSHLVAPGGTMSWGAYLGIIAGFLFVLRRFHTPSLPVLDVLGSCLTLGPFIGRWSCLLNGDDYGRITDVPWAIRYPAGSFPFAQHANDGIIPYTATLSAPVHPNQLYLSANALFLFLLLSWAWKRYRHHPGITFGLLCLTYGVTRFFLEFFRDEAPSTLVPPLTPSQLYSLVTAVTGAFLLLVVHRTAVSSLLPTPGGGERTIRGDMP